MALPISESGSATINSGTRAVSSETPNKREAATPADDRVSGASADTLSLSRAAEVLNEGIVGSETSILQSADQAQVMAQGLKAMFEGQPSMALAGQAGSVSPDIGALLKVG